MQPRSRDPKRRRRAAVAGLVAIAAAILIAAAAASEPPAIGPEQALALAARGELTIIDIRRPSEWRQTGVPTGAALASLHSRRGTEGFVEEIDGLAGGDKAKPLALICAGGVRSRLAATLLRLRGYTNVFDIREGVLGSDDGPGWRERWLPMSACPNCSPR